MKYLYLLYAITFVVPNIVGLNVSAPEFGTLIGSEAKTAWTSKTIYQFLGVRYAKPPSGVNRYKPPKLAIPWPGIHDVRKAGRPCTVLAYINNMTAEELEGDLEDCLHLSIYSKNVSGNYPVMLYIHGGGFEDGASDQHPPNYLLEKDIVLVVPEYRLGPLGFISTHTEDIPGNAGLLDVLLAIDWTKSFISNFGGDSKRLTIFGQSAGAAIASAILISPMTPPNLFENIILQSGSVTAKWATDDQPLAYARKIGHFLGCPDTNFTDALNSCLRNADVISLLKAYHQTRTYPKLTIGGPGNRILPSSLLELITNYSPKDVTLVAGVTKHDGSFILSAYYDYLLKMYGDSLDGLNFLKYILQRSGMLDSSGAFNGFIEKEYFTQEQLIEKNLTKMIPGLMDICGAIQLKAPVLHIAQIHAKYWAKKTYLYSFDYSGEFTRFGYFQDTSHYPFDGGIHHSNDNIYLFPWPEFVSKLNSADTKISQRMVQLWTSVAISNRPSAENVIEWPPLTKFSGPLMHINTTNTISNDFLDEFTVSIRNGSHNNQIRFTGSRFATYVCAIFLVLQQYFL